MFDFWIQFALVLTAILIGIRRGGVALGLIGGLGVAVSRRLPRSTAKKKAICPA